MPINELEYLRCRRDEIDHSIRIGELPDEDRDLYLAEDYRAVHSYICGRPGTGKSRFMEAMIIGDIVKGHPVCVIDPGGDLYERLQNFIAACIQRAERDGHSRERLMERFLFLDASNEDNPIRFNPLAPHPDESAASQADDVLRAIQRLFGDLREQRRIKNTLAGALTIAAELNRLPETEQPKLGMGYDLAYPLGLQFIKEFLRMDNEDRQRLLDALPHKQSLEFRRSYMEFFAQLDKREQTSFVMSSWNVLRDLLEDPVVLNVLGTHSPKSTESTVHLVDVFREGRCLFCYLPEGTLTGSQVVGTYITTKLAESAHRRPRSQWQQQYYLYIDEFHNFADRDFGQALTNLRKYGLRVTMAHQSQTQPPFDTPEGRSLLTIVKTTSKIKAIFQVERDDAETLAKELFRLTQKRPSHLVTTRMLSTAELKSWNESFSFTKTKGTKLSWSRTRGETLGETQNISIGKSFGTNVGATLANALGGSSAKSWAHAISHSEANGVTETFSKQHQVSVSLGENWAKAVNHSNGVSVVLGENESFIEQQGESRGTTTSQNSTRTEAAGATQQRSDGRGRTLSWAGNNNVTYYDDGTENVSSGCHQGISEITNAVDTHGSSLSTALAEMRGVSQSLTASRSSGHGRGVSQQRGRDRKEAITLTESGAKARTEGDTRTHSTGTNHTTTDGTTDTESTTETSSWQETLSKAFSVIEQATRQYGEALSRAVQVTEGITRSEEHGFSETHQVSRGGARTETRSRSVVEATYTLEGERELWINALQALKQREFFISTAALEASLVCTPYVPQKYYSSRTEDLVASLMEVQRERLLPAKKDLASGGELLSEEEVTDSSSESEADDPDNPFLD